MQKVFYAIFGVVVALLVSVFMYDKYQESFRLDNMVYAEKYVQEDFSGYEDRDLVKINKAIVLFNEKKYQDSYDMVADCQLGNVFIRNIRAIVLANIYLADPSICDEMSVLNVVNDMEYSDIKAILLNLLKEKEIKQNSNLLFVLLNNRRNIDVVK